MYDGARYMLDLSLRIALNGESSRDAALSWESPLFEGAVVRQ